MIYCIKENCPLGGCPHHRIQGLHENGIALDVRDMEGTETCAWVTSGEQGDAS